MIGLINMSVAIKALTINSHKKAMIKYKCQKNNALCGILLILFIFIFSLSVEAQKKSVCIRIARVELTNGPFKFHSALLNEQVAEAMQLGKEGLVEPIDLLMEMYKSDPDKVIILIEPYVSDSNADAYTIIRAASKAKTAKSLALLTALVTDSSLGWEATRNIYYNFDYWQVINWGGKKLKTNLFHSVFKSRYSTHGYLLLSCFKNDEDTISFWSSAGKALI